MTYEEFKAEYNKTFSSMMKYTVDQAGSNIYAGKLADLADKYPAFEEALENEHFNTKLSA